MLTEFITIVSVHVTEFIWRKRFDRIDQSRYGTYYFRTKFDALSLTSFYCYSIFGNKLQRFHVTAKKWKHFS